MVFGRIRSKLRLAPAELPGGLFCLLFGVLLLLLLWAVYSPYRGYSLSEQLVLIPRGSSPSEIARLLEARGVVRSETVFRLGLRLGYQARLLKAGEYRFDRPLNLPQVMHKLHQGQVHHYRVTIPEGMSMREITERFVDAGFGSENGFRSVLHQTSSLADLDPQADNLEGYLFPDTYFLTRDMSEAEIIQAMVDNFRQVWITGRRQRAAQLDLTPREVVTLASLIEKETGLTEERPLVSAVFHNRLKRNLKLACDPTVIYAVKLVKEYDGVIHQSDLNLDSPYNTYLYPGLPPGPIANPGTESIDAALHPADVDYLYFVSRNDGSHMFSTNYGDHHRAVRKYQRPRLSVMKTGPIR